MKTINELNAGELTALAFTGFEYKRFTLTELATYICSLTLSRRMTLADVSDVGSLVRLATGIRFIEEVAGPRGGQGFAVTEEGVDASSDVVLPMEKFEKRLALAKERTTEAEANAGPMLERLLKASRNDDRAREFINSVTKQWIKSKWISTGQSNTLARIAEAMDQPINARSYVGAAMNEWVEEYADRLNAVEQARNAQEYSAARARHDAYNEKMRAERVATELNRKIKIFLQEHVAANRLDDLEAMANAIFPGASVIPQARTSAFTGAGAKTLRACIAALAFDKPPSDVWFNLGRGDSQPDTDSIAWKTLLAHPALQVYKRGALLDLPNLPILASTPAA